MKREQADEKEYKKEPGVMETWLRAPFCIDILSFTPLTAGKKQHICGVENALMVNKVTQWT